jgi:2-polyprenyl-3-methyl-5-hydroxy-6-metoxy-1,4-benzoquinol methylase
LPDVHARLQRPGARIADVACGAGWSSVVLARAYPQAEVVGIDADAASIEEARRTVDSCGLGDRVALHVSDVGRGLEGPPCQLVCLFDALHDMSRPVEVLRACRALLAPDGCMLLMEPRVHDSFTAPGDEMERFMYAISVLHCLPVGLADQPSAGTGTVMRIDTVERYARQAGFASLTVLDVEHRFHRLYRLDVAGRSDRAEVPAATF